MTPDVSINSVWGWIGYSCYVFFLAELSDINDITVVPGSPQYAPDYIMAFVNIFPYFHAC